MDEYPELPEFLSLAVYHSEFSDNIDEYFTALSKDRRLISDLYKGKEGETRFPKTFKEEPSDNILFTLHNHHYGAIIPSGGDIHNVINPDIQFTGIVSEDNFGLIINKNKKRSDKEKERIENDFELFDMYVTLCFVRDCEKNINKIERLKLNENESERKQQELFSKYVSQNNNKFANEFNSRMEKYNIELIQIKL